MPTIRRRPRTARLVWTAALVLYLLHVAAAFHFQYGWSHAIALRETARQTRELFGVDSGSGLYLNYLFTAIWISDCLWWWLLPMGYAARPIAVSAVIQGFMGFMFVNATVVVWMIRAMR